MRLLPGLGFALLTLLTCCSDRSPATGKVEAAPKHIVADGSSAATILVHFTRAVAADEIRVALNGPGRLAEIANREADTVQIRYVPSVNPGSAIVKISGRGVVPLSVPLTIETQSSDKFSDGTPDFLRLDERDGQNFRRWFTVLAEREAMIDPASRAREITDCGALLRFAYRETLRRHDSKWAAGMPLEGIPLPAEIDKYEYPHTPLGANLFRTREGGFRLEDLQEGGFAEFADAKTLATLNSYLVSRDLRAARPGDLLFFRQPEQHSPYHSMIFVGKSHFAEGDGEWIVYHTGPDGQQKGEMRRVTEDELRHHPDARWHPVSTNPNFLGVFRWNILREAN